MVGEHLDARSRSRVGAALLALMVATVGVSCASADGTEAEVIATRESAARPTTTSPGTASSTTTAPEATTPASTTTAPATTAPATTGPPEPEWQLGATPLPLRPDGFGQVLPTPEPLVDRRLATVSSLPPPTSDRFEHTVAAIDDATAQRMGRTWTPGCPVGLDELRYVTVSFWGFDAGHHTGELVVHHDVADDVVQVFSRLHAERFPIEQMRLITDTDLGAAPTGDGNNSAAFVCRRIRQGSSWSAHALGLAVDINPFHNPYLRDGLVLPELASAYLDRSWVRPGMVLPGDVVTRSFAEVGWHWGGDWRNPDHMHFSANGR